MKKQNFALFFLLSMCFVNVFASLNVPQRKKAIFYDFTASW